MACFFCVCGASAGDGSVPSVRRTPRGLCGARWRRRRRVRVRRAPRCALAAQRQQLFAEVLLRRWRAAARQTCCALQLSGHVESTALVDLVGTHLYSRAATSLSQKLESPEAKLVSPSISKPRERRYPLLEISAATLRTPPTPLCSAWALSDSTAAAPRDLSH